MATRSTKKTRPGAAGVPGRAPASATTDIAPSAEPPQAGAATSVTSEETAQPPAPDEGEDTPATADPDGAGDDGARSVQLRRKDFVDRIAARSGRKRSDVRSVAEAALDVLAEALAQGDEIILPPLGRIKVIKAKDGPRMRILTLRLQQIRGPVRHDATPADEGLADTGDTG